MANKMKKLSVLLVLVFMLQSILMSAVYAAETADVVLEISIPQLSLTGYSNTPETIELIWTNTDNSIKASTYEIYRDNNLIKTVAGFNYTDTGLAPQTEYTYLVKAKNADGKDIAASNILSITTNLTGSTISLEQSGDGGILKHGAPDFKTDRFIVKYKNENSKKSARKALEKMDTKTNIFDKEFKKLLKENKQDKVVKPFSNSIESNANITDIGNISGNENIDIIPLNEDATLQDFTAALEKNNITENIEYVQPDYQLSLSSNDPYYSSQWGLKNNSEETNNNVDIDVSKELKVTDSALNIQTGLKQNYLCDAGVTEAWEKATGKGATVAVIDTGVDITHEDLAENIWVNEKEIPDNGIDDDGNGKIDDINGWNFSDNSNIVCDNTNLTGENHGTHLAGIISAVKDNSKGIAGVAPSAKVMPLKVFKDGKAYTSDVINAIQYAESMGMKIVNCSWGGTDDNPALKEAIQNSSMLFVCAVGNSGTDIDSNPVYPAAFDCSNIIAVASINQNGQLSRFSNFGQNNADVAAPGEGIYSTLTGNTYGEKSGTSMAAAFVSGEAALLFSNSANMGATGMKEQIVKCSEHLSSLTGKVNKSAKINCINAIDNISSEEIISIPDIATTQGAINLTESNGSLSLYSTSTVAGQFTKIAGGGYHSLALKNDGTVWTCGRNCHGQLGDGTTTNSSIPKPVNGLSGIIGLAGGGFHSLALKSDGTVWAWGNNELGELGNGTTIQALTPVPVSGLSGVTAIAGGGMHSLALKNDGTVWTWGNNTYGQLGNGTTADSTVPVQVSGLSGIVAIAGGSYHSMALKNDGTVWAWGYNNKGQLGNGTTVDSAVPIQVSGLSGITSIACGAYFSAALKNDGTVWTVGHNNIGQLGDETTANKSLPVKVSGLSGITAISCGDCHTLALKGDGTAWAWGYDGYGQIGAGTTVYIKIVPVQVKGLTGIKAIAAGGYHTWALDNSGSIWTCGWNEYGQLGDGMTENRNLPVQVSETVKITSVAGGGYHSLALKNDGTVWTCGRNCYGQLGNGTTTNSSIPKQVNGLSGITGIAGGGFHSLALKSDGTVWAWGSNELGELGNGTTIQALTPVPVSGLSGVTAIAGGGRHSLALKNDGTVWTWGNNTYGQLGNGTTANSTVPVQVSGLSGIVAIAGGSYHSMALKNDGTVWAWGYNNNGQLGNSTTVNSAVPIQVSGLSGITSIACGAYFSAALKNDGTVWTVGHNNVGQLGDGTTANKSLPVKVSGLSGITAISCGDCHTLALKGDGTAWAWGYDGYGQIGAGTTAYIKIVPVQVSGLTGIKAIAAGGYHTWALNSSGEIWACGWNEFGQLGDRTTENRSLPVKVSLINPITTTNLVLKLKNVKSFTNRTFTVTYNANAISGVVDLCGFTYQKELSTGPIAGTYITILQNNSGIIKFTIDRNIPDGKAWSGVVNIFKFKSTGNGEANFNCKVE